MAGFNSVLALSQIPLGHWDCSQLLGRPLRLEVRFFVFFLFKNIKMIQVDQSKKKMAEGCFSHQNSGALLFYHFLSIFGFFC